MREAATTRDRLEARSRSFSVYGGVTSVVLASLFVQSVVLFNEKAPESGPVGIIILIAAAWWASEVRRLRHHRA